MSRGLDAAAVEMTDGAHPRQQMSVVADSGAPMSTARHLALADCALCNSPHPAGAEPIRPLELGTASVGGRVVGPVVARFAGGCALHRAAQPWSCPWRLSLSGRRGGRSNPRLGADVGAAIDQPHRGDLCTVSDGRRPDSEHFAMPTVGGYVGTMRCDATAMLAVPGRAVSKGALSWRRSRRAPPGARVICTRWWFGMAVGSQSALGAAGLAGSQAGMPRPSWPRGSAHSVGWSL